MNDSKWTKESLHELLLQVCDDIQNCKGPISYFEMPDYLKDYWADYREEFYEKGLKSERYQKYLELKKEFDPNN